MHPQLHPCDELEFLGTNLKKNKRRPVQSVISALDKPDYLSCSQTLSDMIGKTVFRVLDVAAQRECMKMKIDSKDFLVPTGKEVTLKVADDCEALLQVKEALSKTSARTR